MNKLKLFLNKKIVVGVVSFVMLTLLLSGFFAIVKAWTNPSQNPPNGSGALTVDSNGNVGIGDTTPSAKLEVSGNASTTQLTTTNNTYLATTGGRVGIATLSPQGYLGITNGTENVFGDTTELMITGPSLTPVDNGKGNIVIQSNNAMAADKGGSIVFGGRVTTGSTNSAHWGGIGGYKETGTSDNYGGYLAFSTRNLSAIEGEKMRINASGNVGIATTSPQAKLDVDGTLRAGGITDTQKAYGQAYRTTSYSIAAVNTWYDLDLNGGNNNLKNISHSTSINPDRITVTYAGVYRILFLVHTLQAGAAFGADTRLRVNDSTEIPGSAVGAGDSGGSIQTPVSVNVIVSLAANDYITLQVGANTTGAVINRYNDGNNPDPTTTIVAIVTIEKIE